MMIRLPGWKPPVIVSRSAKPEGVPVSERPSAESSCHLRDLGVQDLADAAEVLLAVVVGDLEHGALGPLDELARRRLVAVDAGLDLVGGGEQAAQERAVADDLRVLAQVADRGDGGGERVDLRLAAGRVEPAARAQVLGDGEDVDRARPP